MKILFILPNVSEFGVKPIGISLLSAISKNCGHQTELFDLTFYEFSEIDDCINNSSIYALKNQAKYVDYEKYGIRKLKINLRECLHQKLFEYKPDLCAFSLMTSERDLSRKLADYIKEYDNNIPIIWGGIYPTSSPEEAISYSSVDYICLYEGIEALSELLDAIENKKDTTKIKNIYEKKNGKIIRNEIRSKFQGLNSLPYLDWEIFDKRKFLRPFKGKIITGGEFMSIIGCPNRCTYCMNNWLNKEDRRIRFYSPKRIIEEIKYLKVKYSLDFLTFRDDDFLLRPMNDFVEFAELYRNEIHLPFAIQTNSKSVTEEKVRILKSMSLNSVNIGIETGDEYIRREVLKRIDSFEEVENAFRLFNEAGIETHALNMIGLPTETRETIFKTIEYNRKIKPTVSYVSIFYPFERTELYDLCVEKKWFKPGKKKQIDILRFSALNLPEISKEEVEGLNKCFTMYVKLPKSFRRLIERAEKNDKTGHELFKILSEIYYDHVLEKDGYFRE